jgi:hypothetical protein
LFNGLGNSDAFLFAETATYDLYTDRHTFDEVKIICVDQR